MKRRLDSLRRKFLHRLLEQAACSVAKSYKLGFVAPLHFAVGRDSFGMVDLAIIWRQSIVNPNEVIEGLNTGKENTSGLMRPADVLKIANFWLTPFQNLLSLQWESFSLLNARPEFLLDAAKREAEDPLNTRAMPQKIQHPWSAFERHFKMF